MTALFGALRSKQYSARRRCYDASLRNRNCYGSFGSATKNRSPVARGSECYYWQFYGAVNAMGGQPCLFGAPGLHACLLP